MTHEEIRKFYKKEYGIPSISVGFSKWLRKQKTLDMVELWAECNKPEFIDEFLYSAGLYEVLEPRVAEAMRVELLLTKGLHPETPIPLDVAMVNCPLFYHKFGSEEKLCDFIQKYIPDVGILLDRKKKASGGK